MVVVAGHTASGQTLLLTKGSFITGEVVEVGTRKPIRGVLVQAWDDDLRVTGYTGADGTYRLRCPPGVYELIASRVPGSHVRPSFSRRRRTVLARKGTDVEGPTLELSRATELAGTVVTPAGEPVSGIKVRVTALGMMPSGWSKTDRHGNFRVTGLMPNRHYSITCDHEQMGLAACLNLRAEEKPGEALLVKLRPTVAVRGRVVDAQGRPAEGVKVHSRLVARGRIPWRTRRTDAQGTYQFLAPPNVRLHVYVGGYAASDPESRRHRDLVAETGRPNAIDDLVWQAFSKTIISGRVLGPTGQPVPGASVRATLGWRRRNAIADDRGEFRFKETETDGDPIELVTRSADRTLAGQLAVTATGSATHAVMRLVGAAAIQGRVTDEQGRPIPGVEVSFTTEGGRRTDRFDHVTATTDADGRFRLAGLIPGQQGHVSTEAPGYGNARREGLDLAAGMVTRVPDFVLMEARHFISGRVADSEGRPMASVEIRCSGRGFLETKAHTNHLGRYRAGPIPNVDAVEVEAYDPDHEPSERTSVQAGARGVDFRLKPKERGGL